MSNSRQIQQLGTFYEDIDVFVIDEVNAMSASALSQMYETMTAILNPQQ